MKTLTQINLNDIMGKITQCTYKNCIVTIQNDNVTIYKNNKYKTSFLIDYIREPIKSIKDKIRMECNK